MGQAYQLPGLECPACQEKALRLVVEGNGNRKVCYLACVACRDVEDPVSMDELCSIVTGIAKRATEVNHIDPEWIQGYIKEVLGYED